VTCKLGKNGEPQTKNLVVDAVLVGARANRKQD